MIGIFVERKMTDLRYKLIPLLLLFQANILQSLAELAGNYTTGVDELVFAHVVWKLFLFNSNLIELFIQEYLKFCASFWAF